MLYNSSLRDIYDESVQQQNTNIKGGVSNGIEFTPKTILNESLKVLIDMKLSHLNSLLRGIDLGGPLNHYKNLLKQM